MSRSLRAQVSLIFSDEDLFDNFITPLKDNKELSGTIIKLLSAYYSSEEVRNLVEGVSMDDVVEDSDKIIDSTEAINQMRQTLAMQDFLFEQAIQTLDDGASEMDALMKANDIAKHSGVVKTESTDVGEALVKLSLENTTLDRQFKGSSESANSSDLENRVEKIEEMLGNIMTLIQSGSLGSNSSLTSNSDYSEIIEDDTKTSILNDEAEVSTINQSSSVVLEDTVETSNDSVSGNAVEEDASSELDDVLKDLLG